MLPVADSRLSFSSGSFRTRGTSGWASVLSPASYRVSTLCLFQSLCLLGSFSICLSHLLCLLCLPSARLYDRYLSPSRNGGAEREGERPPITQKGRNSRNKTSSVVIAQVLMFSDYGPRNGFPPVFFSARDRTLSRLCSYLCHKTSSHNSKYLMRSTHFLGLGVMGTEMNSRSLFSIPVAYRVVGRKQGP